VDAATHSRLNGCWLTSETAAGHEVTYDYNDDGLLTDGGELELTRDPDHGLVTGSSLADIVGTEIQVMGKELEFLMTRIAIRMKRFWIGSLGKLSEKDPVLSDV